MNKILIILFLMLYVSVPVFAKNIKVQALSYFSTETPPETWSVKVVEGVETKRGYLIYAGSIIQGRIENVKDPKRLKRNATFTFVPTDYFDYSSQKWFKVEQEVEAKYSFLSDVSGKSVAKTGAVAVGNKFLDGFFGPGVALIEGAVKNEQGNRAKSAVISVYESTPLSYTNKGKQLVIPEGHVFIMNFKMQED